MSKRVLSRFKRFYFVGIGGVSMSALAEYLFLRGKYVAGCDASPSIYTEKLKQIGVEVTDDIHRADIREFDCVVYTDAIRPDDITLSEARKIALPILSRGQLLYELSKEFGTVIAVSGCHGKTTCTAMLAHIFYVAGKKFTAHIGGRDKFFTNLYAGGKDFFLTEACEYKKNFLLLKPSIAVVLNDGADHLECYGSRENLTLAYKSFLQSADVSVALGSSKIDSLVTFGLDKSCDYYADGVSEKGEGISFCAYEKGDELGRVELCVSGRHNVLNALAAIAAARAASIGFDDIRRGLAAFCGVERRFETIAERDGIKYIADYAHHPDEIKATLATAKKITRGSMFIVFQPHTYSRTRNLFKEFVKALQPHRNVLIYKTYAAREYFDDAGSALTLSRALRKSRYGETERDIENFISAARDGDTVLFIGAGDIYDIAKKTIKK